MKVQKISDNVHYVGVNDRTTDRFESLWPLPNGVSYNSYLVTGSDKSAIIDGVELSHALQQIDAVKSILGDRQPDYLVINHMEPDHSGAISLLRQAFPDLTIVGNAQALSMVEGFYGVTGNFLTVKEGDELSLGENVTLSFIMTPMVHWPETMVTYLRENKLAFSGDAFGCFGALNGAVVDTDMDTDRYFSEMIRYYSNIVEKYGVFVQKAIKKLDNIEIETICPTHGPVWHDRIEEVVGLYNRLSRYEPLTDGVTIVYGSMYGNTERMAEFVAEALADAGVRNISIRNAAKDDLSFIIADLFTNAGVVIASPTYSDTVFPPLAAVIDAMTLRGLVNRPTAVLGEYTWSPQAAKKITARLAECGITPVIEPISAKQSPTAEVLESCKTLAYALAGQLKKADTPS